MKRPRAQKHSLTKIEASPTTYDTACLSGHISAATQGGGSGTSLLEEAAGGGRMGLGMIGDRRFMGGGLGAPAAGAWVGMTARWTTSEGCVAAGSAKLTQPA